MAYNITLSNGTTLPVVIDGVTDTTSTSITLIGKNYVGYGAFLNQNFARILENFSNVTAPEHPLTGQLWWDSNQKTLKAYTGAGWKGLASSTVAATAPSAPATGDQWFDTSVGQLKAWDGATWLTIGPAFTSGQGISGAIAETITDNIGSSHVVVRFYISGVTVGILSNDATFTPSTAILGFSTIKPGLNLSTAGNLLFYNDAFNALNLGGIPASNYARTDTATTFNSTVSVANNNGLAVGSSSGGDFVANVTSSGVNLRSTVTGKSLNLLVAGQTNPALSIASGTGLATVLADPVTNFGVATKQYVDSAVGTSLSGSTLVLRRDGANSVTGVLAPDVTATRDFGTSSLRFAKVYATGANIAGQVELTGALSGIKFNDGTVQTTAATSVAAGSITPDRLSAGGPYWAGDGKLGVGTANPVSTLHVVGDVPLTISNSTTNNSNKSGRLVSTHYSTSNNPVGLIGLNTTSVLNQLEIGGGFTNVTAATAISFYTAADSITAGGTERLRIDTNGNVSIGVSSTTAKLEVNGQIRTSSGLHITQSGAGVKFPDDTLQTTAAVPSIGTGQTWQNVTSSRAAGATYTNTTGKPIQVIVSAQSNAGGDGTANLQAVVDALTIDRVAIEYYWSNVVVAFRNSVSFIVPAGATYGVNVSHSSTLGSWYELR
jgi:hypothetical protein